MSRASKLTFTVVTALSIGTVWGVHYLQQKERADMHAGIERDEKRQAIKRQRILDNQLQSQLQKEYEQVQPVTRKSSG